MAAACGGMVVHGWPGQGGERRIVKWGAGGEQVAAAAGSEETAPWL